MALLSPNFSPPIAAPRYGSIVVFVDLKPEDAALVKAAAGIANEFGAKLVGLSAFNSTFENRDLPPVETEAARLIVEAAGVRFAKLTENVHAGSVWAANAFAPAATLGALQWAADLVVAAHPM